MLFSLLLEITILYRCIYSIGRSANLKVQPFLRTSRKYNLKLNFHIFPVKYYFECDVKKRPSQKPLSM